jgi:uncharacterized protein (AIM24 family)
MTITCKVTGEFAQNITCQLEADQSMFADATKFRWKTTNVALETRLSTPGGKADDANKQAKESGGGFLKAAMATAVEVGKRAMSGQSLAFQWFTPSGGSGLVGFAGDLPGQVRVIELDGTTGWHAESRAFVCAEATVAYDIDFSGLALGYRSRNGFIYEHFTGSGSVVLAGGGSLLDLNPADYGGKIQVHGGAIVAYSDAVNFSVERVGSLNAQTMMTAAFGGSGLNLATLIGDGPVILQSMLHKEFEEEDKQDASASSSSRQGLLGRI